MANATSVHSEPTSFPMVNAHLPTHYANSSILPMVIAHNAMIRSKSKKVNASKSNKFFLMLIAHSFSKEYVWIVQKDTSSKAMVSVDCWIPIAKVTTNYQVNAHNAIVDLFLKRQNVSIRQLMCHPSIPTVSSSNKMNV